MCDIVIRSYYRDVSWLRWSLASIERWCRGFGRVVVVVPRSSVAKLRWAGLLAGPHEVALCPDYVDDYLGQQVTKLHADLVTNAEFICHVDSDCVFTCPTSPADLLSDGRPVVLAAPYSSLDRHVPWRAVTEAFVGFEVRHEFMRSPPYTFPRWLYPEVREVARARHGVELDRYVLSRPARGFSEFNVLGAWAERHHPTAFHWRYLSGPEIPPGPLRVFWSRTSVDEHLRELQRLVPRDGVPGVPAPRQHREDDPAAAHERKRSTSSAP